MSRELVFVSNADDGREWKYDVNNTMTVINVVKALDEMRSATKSLLFVCRQNENKSKIVSARLLRPTTLLLQHLDAGGGSVGFTSRLVLRAPGGNKKGVIERAETVLDTSGTKVMAKGKFAKGCNASSLDSDSEWVSARDGDGMPDMKASERYNWSSDEDDDEKDGASLVPKFSIRARSVDTGETTMSNTTIAPIPMPLKRPSHSRERGGHFRSPSLDLSAAKKSTPLANPFTKEPRADLCTTNPFVSDYVLQFQASSKKARVRKLQSEGKAKAKRSKKESTNKAVRSNEESTSSTSTSKSTAASVSRNEPVPTTTEKEKPRRRRRKQSSAIILEHPQQVEESAKTTSAVVVPEFDTFDENAVFDDGAFAQAPEFCGQSTVALPQN